MTAALIAACAVTAEATQYTVHRAARDADYLAQATKRLRDDIGRTPFESEWPGMLVDAADAPQGWKGPYVERLRLDPWGVPMAYARRTDAPAGFHVWSFGRDGVDDAGGGDDVSSWTGYDADSYFPHRWRDRLLACGLLAGIVLALGCGVIWLWRLARRLLARLVQRSA